MAWRSADGNAFLQTMLIDGTILIDLFLKLRISLKKNVKLKVRVWGKMTMFANIYNIEVKCDVRITYRLF